MRHEQLLHAIRAACDLSGDVEVWIFGSQAILGNFPQAEHIEHLSASREIDLTPKNKIEKIDDIDMYLGEGSTFDDTHGFYVHGVPIEEAAYLPQNWKLRCIEVETPGHDNKTKKAFCIEVHDLISSKLVRFAQKDIEFAEAAVRFGLADPNRIMMRIEQIKDARVSIEQLEKMKKWCRRSIEKFERPDDEIIGLPYGQHTEGDYYRTLYPPEPASDGPECGVVTKDGRRCRRRGQCPLHYED